MPLTKSQRLHLRRLAHTLKPIVMIGEKGVTDNVLNELNRALTDHELIKVTIAGAERTERQTITETLCQVSQAELVQMIGRISVLYRPCREPRIVLPA